MPMPSDLNDVTLTEADTSRLKLILVQNMMDYQQELQRYVHAIDSRVCRIEESLLLAGQHSNHEDHAMPQGGQSATSSSKREGGDPSDIHLSQQGIFQHDVRGSEAGTDSLSQEVIFESGNVDAVLRDLKIATAQLEAWRCSVDAQLESMRQGDPSRTCSIVSTPTTSITKEIPDDENVHEYELVDSVYDSAFLIGLNVFSAVESFLLAFGFIVYISIVSITVYMLTLPTFTSPPSFTEARKLLLWRLTEAHAYPNVHWLQGQTLMSRVCEMDPSLQVASNQISEYNASVEYKDYGRYVSNLAVGLWICCCMLEVRTTFQFLVAIWMLPRARHSEYRKTPHGLKWEVMSRSRVLIGTCVAIFRGCLALFMLVCGCMWLSYTEKLEELLLNASALGFVLDIDDVIFGVVAPVRAIAFIRQLEPLPFHIFSGPCKILIPVLLCLASIGTLVYINIDMLPLVENRMELVRTALCEPSSSHSVVIGLDPLTRVMYTRRPPGIGESYQLVVDAKLDVVQKILNSTGDAGEYALHLRDEHELSYTATLSIEEYVNKQSCIDQDVNVSVGKHLWTITGNSSLKGLADCGQARTYCRDATAVGLNTRFLCPITCDCANLPGQLSKPQGGCTVRCKDRNETFVNETVPS